MNIYVASSWRNPWQPTVVNLLRNLGHEVYDFRNPEPGNDGFAWSDIDPDWKTWTPEKFREGLVHPLAEEGFALDMNALKRCDACVLVQPCGTSAHLELGWASGAGKRTAILFPDDISRSPEIDAPERKIEPELMVKMADAILIGSRELHLWLEWAERPDPYGRPRSALEEV